MLTVAKKAQIIQIEESTSGVHGLEAKLIVKRGDKLQTVTVHAWDMPSYERLCKIVASAVRRMRR